MIRLDVAGAFHSPAMEPAVAPFRAALDEVEVSEPTLHRLLRRERRAVHGRARRARDRPDPARALAGDRHRHARGRAPSFVEVGPGKVLARMGKRILKGVPFETPAEGLIHA